MKMMIKVGFFALFTAVLGLMSACNNAPSTVYSYSSPTTPDGRACVDECKQSLATCKQLCTAVDPQCVAEGHEKAREAYQDYLRGQNVTQELPTQTLASFYNPEECAHTGCGCESEYKVCYQLCGTRTEVHDSMASE